jgi:hypothetical protein
VFGEGLGFHRVWLDNASRRKVDTTAAVVFKIEVASTAQEGSALVKSKGRCAGLGVPWVVFSMHRDKQTDMFGIFDRTTHLGLVVWLRELLFLACVGKVAGDEELELC